MSTISAGTTSTTTLIATGDTTGSLVFKTNDTGSGGTTAMTIATNQVVTFAQAPVLPAASIPQVALATGVAGTGPTFSAYQSTSTGSISASTFTKLLFNTELWDTNNNFASSTFTPTVAGYYQINAAYQVAPVVAGFITIYKNGTEYKRGAWISGGTFQDLAVSGLVYCNGTTDYIDIYIYQVTTTTTVQGGAVISWVDGFLARAA